MAEPESAAEIERLALKLLAAREHSRSELLHKLAARGHDPEAAALVLDRLAATGAQSEDRLAETYVAERVRKGLGPRRIRAELREKGLSDQVIAPHLEALEGEWPDLLALVHERRFGPHPPADQADYGRRGRFLEQRGFPPELIRRHLRRHD